MAKGKGSLRTLKKVLGFVKRYFFWIFLSVLLAAASVAGTLYIPIVIGEAIDFIIGEGQVNFAEITPLLIRAAIVAGATALCQWLMSVINNRVVFHVVRDIRNAAFRKIEELPLSFLDRNPVGDIVSRVIADADQFADGLLMGFTQLFTGVMTIAGTLVFMLSINPWITLVVVVLTPVSLFVAKFIAGRTYNMFKLQSETRGEQTAFIDEMIGNQKVVKAFGREDEAIEKFDEINLRLEKAYLNATFFSSLVNPSTRFVNSLVYAGVGLTGAVAAI
ncbi:MAG: ABC transporter ATP-binding protein, partial [Oscillospiraceae bacterium]|nr:ABC transporter ATP-binding protein [Oscillospiraceae bacterium]